MSSMVSEAPVPANPTGAEPTKGGPIPDRPRQILIQIDYSSKPATVM